MEAPAVLPGFELPAGFGEPTPPAPAYPLSLDVVAKEAGGSVANTKTNIFFDLPHGYKFTATDLGTSLIGSLKKSWSWVNFSSIPEEQYDAVYKAFKAEMEASWNTLHPGVVPARSERDDGMIYTVSGQAPSYNVFAAGLAALGMAAGEILQLWNAFYGTPAH